MKGKGKEDHSLHGEQRGFKIGGFAPGEREEWYKKERERNPRITVPRGKKVRVYF